MTKTEIREKFRNFIGNKTFQKFLTELNRIGPERTSLFYWQQKLWSEFENEFELEKAEFTTLLSYFRYCPVHNLELESELVAVVDGESIDEEELTLIEFNSRFPFANYILYRRIGVDTIQEQKTYYCPQCRKVKQQLKKNLV